MRDAWVVLLCVDGPAGRLRVLLHGAELVHREELAAFAHASLPVDDAPGRAPHEEHDERYEGSGQEHAEGSAHEVEHPFGAAAVCALVEVEDAHEPARRQVAKRDPAEHVLEEVRDADDLEPARCDVEQRLQGPARAGALCQHDQVGTVSLDDPGEVGDLPEHGDAAVALHPRLVVDDAHDRERDIRRLLRGLRDVGGPGARSHHENAPLRGEQASPHRLPSGREKEDRHRHHQERRRREARMG